MRSLNRLLPVTVLVLSAVFAFPVRAQMNKGKTQSNAAAPSQANVREDNIEEYIELIRSDVRRDKAEIMGSLMLLSAADAEKFWPIYSAYDTELARLNDQRLANIKEYAAAYPEMTDQKANELIENGFKYQEQRSELLAKTYDQVKQALGAVTAGRFVQIEHQLLLIIDLQIASSLPVAGQSS